MDPLNNQEALVSIILPVYNVEKTVADSIQSILNQSWSNFELLILEDGCSDQTLAVISKISDHRIHLFPDRQNKGLSYRLNQGIQLAKGEYIARIDGDDLMFANRLKSQIQYLHKNSNVDVIGSWAVAFDNNNELVGMMRSSLPENVNQLAIRGNCFIHPSVTAKTKWFKKNNYDPNFLRCEDIELWIRTFSEKSFHIIQEPMIFYRTNGVQPLWKYRIAYKELRLVIKKNTNRISFKARALVRVKSSIRLFFYPILVKLKLLNYLEPLNTIQHEKYFAELSSIIKK